MRAARVGMETTSFTSGASVARYIMHRRKAEKTTSAVCRRKA